MKNDPDQSMCLSVKLSKINVFTIADFQKIFFLPLFPFLVTKEKHICG